MTGLDQHATAELQVLQSQNLRRTIQPTARAAGSADPCVWRGGRQLVSFSCNDYLNFATHPAVIEASVDATRRYGAGAGASRLVTGDHPLIGQLEARLATLKHTEAACLFGSGYLANIGIIPAIVGQGDLVLADELAHACILAGTQLSRARWRRFRHNDLQDLEHILAASRAAARHVLIVTDRVFSMDGDLAPVAALAALAARFNAWLMTDDAHGFGVLPPAYAGVDLQMGTLSKAIGSYGGYLCASRAVIDLIHSRARSLIYSTALPPGAVGAALAALDLIDADPARTELPYRHARQFAEAAGLPEPASHIVPLMLGGADRALAAADRLEQEGYLAAAIRPPTVPPGTARLRLTFTAGHLPDDINRLASIVRAL